MMINAQKLDSVMLELGHTENLKGTGYIREGVELFHNGCVRMTKELYPEIAKAAGSTPSRVERCMRHAINSAWGRGNIDAQKHYFGYSVSPERGVPTVGEYIARMARVCGED